MTASAHLVVPQRFCGPPHSGNGGWTAGALAGMAAGHSPGPSWPVISVSLRKPPPLDTALPVSHDESGTTAWLGDTAVATARVQDADLTVVQPVPVALARAARSDYPGLTSHPFPTCFSCGVDRAEGDGLRIFPGQVPDQDGATRVASTWTPHASLAGDAPGGESGLASLASTWAALDCVGGWAGDLTERLMVLVAMTARIDALPVIGQEHVVVGLDRGHDGRKTFTAATLYDADGRLVGCAEHVWVAIDPAILT